MGILTVKRMVESRIPTDLGEFRLFLYRSSEDNKEHLALVMGDVNKKTDVLVRVHSECFTGDVLGSLRCDCGDQLQFTLQSIAQTRIGILVYLRQEGRGIGLLDKLKSYNLQDDGYDTVDANLLLGHRIDERNYSAAAGILKDLGVRSIRLMTNNPGKIEHLQNLNIDVIERVPVQPTVHPENAGYLYTKAHKMKHLLNLSTLASSSNQGGNGNYKR